MSVSWALADLKSILKGFIAGLEASVLIDTNEGASVSSILFSPQVPTESTESKNGGNYC